MTWPARGTQARPEFGRPVAGGDEQLRGLACESESAIAKARSDILAGVPCYREFEVVNRGRPVHGNPGQHTPYDPVFQVRTAPGLDHMTPQRRQDVAAPGMGRDDRIPQLLEGLRARTLGRPSSQSSNEPFPSGTARSLIRILLGRSASGSNRNSRRSKCGPEFATAHPTAYNRIINIIYYVCEAKFGRLSAGFRQICNPSMGMARSRLSSA